MKINQKDESFFGFIMGFALHRAFQECTMQIEVQLHLCHVVSLLAMEGHRYVDTY